MPAKPRTARKPAVKTVLPDTAERQATAALARLTEAEARPGAVLARSRRNGAAEPVPISRAKPAKPVKRSTAAPIEHGGLDLDATIAHMNVEYLQCRDFGHAWRPYHARWIPQDNCYRTDLRCSRCTSMRTRYLSASGAQLSGNYDYPEGYLTKGMGRLTGSDRDRIRLASVLAVITPGSSDD